MEAVTLSRTARYCTHTERNEVTSQVTHAKERSSYYSSAIKLGLWEEWNGSCDTVGGGGHLDIAHTEE